MTIAARPPIVPVILSGGSGTRLWPLSRESQPKQFLSLVSEHSLFQDTLLRTQNLARSATAAIVVCNEGHRFLVAEQSRAIGSVPEAIILEPTGRNTAPALAVAALRAQEAAARRGDRADPLLLVLPADHVIQNVRAFAAAVEAAAEAALAGRVVTFGVVPSSPETGFGYILRGAEHGQWYEVEEFVEKPDRATAEGYVASRRYFWNSGMFVVAAGVYLSELERCAPAIMRASRRAFDEATSDPDFVRLGSAFAACPSDSIDYAVMEKTDRAAVVPLAAAWSDVGSWAALHDVSPKDESGNVFHGDVLAEDCRDSFISARGKLVAALGLTDVVIVATDDAILVARLDHSQHVKRIVERIKARS
jgi:mannose-1-phosphate guanylyltransferase/mannose-6-phosphate isomerase